MSHTSEAEFSKYIVILWHGQEQAVSLPFEAQHAAVLASIQQRYPDAQAVSAGLFCAKAGIFWHGGESISLGLVSRPQDRQLIEALLSSPGREVLGISPSPPPKPRQPPSRPDSRANHDFIQTLNKPIKERTRYVRQQQ